MNRTLAIFAAAVFAALLVLSRLVAISPPTPAAAKPEILESSTDPHVVIAPRSMPSDRRIEVTTDSPIEPGLPPWTVMLATMPASLPPPAGTTPPEVPDGALVPMRGSLSRSVRHGSAGPRSICPRQNRQRRDLTSVGIGARVALPRRWRFQ